MFLMPLPGCFFNAISGVFFKCHFCYYGQRLSQLFMKAVETFHLVQEGSRNVPVSTDF